MTDLIRRDEIGPRLAAAGFGGELLQTAIAALPAALAHPLADEARAALANDDVSGWIGSLPAAPIAEALAVPTEAILQALADHNDLLRSAAAIAGRGVLEGEGIVATANWDAFYNRVKVVLKRHHETTNAVRAALRAIGERADG